jgi:hypothetical protein
MKTHTIAFSVASVLLISLIIIGTFHTTIVSALTATATDATSTASDTTTALASSASAGSTTPATDAGSATPTLPAQTQVSAQSQAQSLPSSKPTLKLVHVVGSKYVDYFTDGKKTYSFPGNPDIDGNLNKPNAPIPSHGNLTWVSSSGMDAYDTPSGDLESGDYAQEADGSYISNVPAYTYTDATSSVPIAAHVSTSKTDPMLAASVSTVDTASTNASTAQ